jgi:hypothetical protein
MACNSSGSPPAEDSVEERPTVVSSDAATISDDPEPAPDDSATVDTGEVDDNTDGEIRTIDDLLAHLDAKNNDTGTGTDEVPADDPLSDSQKDPATADTPQPDDTTPSDPADTAPSDTDAQDPVVTEPDSEDPAVLPVTDASEGDTPASEPADNNDAQSPADETPAVPDTVTPEPEVPDTSEPGVDDPVSDGADDPQPPLNDETIDPTEGFASAKSEIVVDCEQRLPCTASNADGAVSVVVENVYRHPENQRLAIALSVTANRDTALRWDNDITSTDDIATTYNGTSREFSGFYQYDRDNDMVTLLAGTTLLVVQHFREMPLDTTVSLVRFDTGYIEAGVRTALQFSNMPLDPVLGDIVDCNNQVPCSWVSTDQSYSVNVIKASGLWQTGRLRVDFEVRATVGLALNMFSSDPVVGNDGSVFTPRTHSLNGTSDYQEFTAPLIAEGVLTGYQDFLKNADRLTTSLIQVRLGMTRVDAPGAGSPVFRNLPLE